ncbi:sodium:solute symporter family transporter [Sulfuriroseicoccus oceanibius]|uniref:Sodium/solute symporter n=1 Tax=Sulfuriroseicoccus oceanibius TaxID=2707525 RepID=A0A6B3L8H4_9BACT|nr:sodium/solute symporter [Sulfuriroseicoccus oceanibius]QQL44276.1 sodium/solute symporter [Sulfuriroseicoccus oceanibius]
MFRKLFPLLLALMASLPLMASDAIKWSSDFPAIPDDYGYAGAFAGVIGKNDSPRTLVIAGGANFPDADPFTSNVGKAWHDTVFTIPLEGNSLKAAGTWTVSGAKLPLPLGYGASATLPHHGSALFIGGSYKVDGEEIFSNKVYEVTIANGNPVFTEVAQLPTGTSYMAAATIDKNVYVFSGQGAEGEIEQALVLDTSSDNRSDWQWKSMPWPEYSEGVPARARAHYTIGTIGNKLFVFGGRAKQLAGDHRVHKDDVNDLYGTDDFRDCYVYSPGATDAAAGTWARVADLPTAISAAPTNAVPAGASHLLVLGGVDLATLVDLQDKDKYPSLNNARHGFDHPGFPRKVLAYHTITNTWAEQSEIPAEMKAPVTAPVVIAGNDFLVPSGEWSPKLRTSNVLAGTITPPIPDFGWINWSVVAIYLLGMVGVGYWFMKREAASSTEAYFRGGQKIPWWVAGLSIFATMLSALTFMGIPARAYQTDITWYIGQLPILLVAPLVAFCYLPFFRRLNITSAYEYLEKRFGLGVRVFASLSFILFHIGRIAIVLYLPALAVSGVTGIPVTTAIIVISVLCIIYTVMGGIEAVVWTDAIQAMVLIGGALLCFILVVFSLDGGMGELFTIAQADDKLFSNLEWGSFDIKDGTAAVSVLFLAFTFNALVPYTSGQDVVQRYVTTSDEQAARKSLWTTMWMSVFGSLIFFGLGAAIYAFYKTHPDLLSPAMAKTDSILPFYIVQQLPVGVSGLIIAAVFAAAQSTISSSLNSSATAYIKDFDSRLFRPGRDDKTYLRAAQFVVTGIGILGTIVAIIMAKSDIESAFKTFNSIIGLTAGSLGGLFALGIFTRKANGTAALIAAFIGAGVVITLFLTEAPVTGLLYAFIGFATCFVLGIILGTIMPAKPQQLKGLSFSTIKDIGKD